MRRAGRISPSGSACPLSHVLHVVGVLPQAGYVVYFSIEPDPWERIDMADASHPQTFLTYGMNGDELPVGHGGPLRLRLPRQVDYKNVKFITHLTVTDSLKGLGKGLGSAAPEGGYALVCRHLTVRLLGWSATGKRTIGRGLINRWHGRPACCLPFRSQRKEHKPLLHLLSTM
ncbi:MAG TPA: molybdopterin-dependent oxidoreductase [Terriglobales bacterium]